MEKDLRPEERLFEPVEVHPIMIQGIGLSVWVTVPALGPGGHKTQAINPTSPSGLRSDVPNKDFYVNDLDLNVVKTLLEFSLRNVTDEIQRREESE